MIEPDVGVAFVGIAWLFFIFYFSLKLGLRRSVFDVRSPPYPREGISNVLARDSIITVLAVLCKTRGLDAYVMNST